MGTVSSNNNASFARGASYFASGDARFLYCTNLGGHVLGGNCHQKAQLPLGQGRGGLGETGVVGEQGFPYGVGPRRNSSGVNKPRR